MGSDHKMAQTSEYGLKKIQEYKIIRKKYFRYETKYGFIPVWKIYLISRSQLAKFRGIS